MKHRYLRAIRGGLLVLAAATVAFGYAFVTNSNTGMPIKWPDGQIPLIIKLGTDRPLSDGSNFSTSAEAAAQVWNDVVGAVRFQSQIAAAGGGGQQNNLNELVFSNTVYGTPFEGNTVAVTLGWSLGNQRVEADIVFNNARLWDSYRGLSRPGAIDLRRVAIHELGHVLGLDHPDEKGQTVQAIMNSTIGNLDTIAADDRDGAQRLYAVPPFGAAPPNNSFSNASTVTLNNNAAQLTGYNSHASKEIGEPNHASLGGKSVWWRWIAPADGSVNINTQGSVFDTTLGVYTGSNVATLTLVASDDDVEDGRIQYSTVSFNASAGVAYSIAVDGFSDDGLTPDTGGITLNLTLAGAPVPGSSSSSGGSTTPPAPAAAPSGGGGGGGGAPSAWFFGAVALLALNRRLRRA